MNWALNNLTAPDSYTPQATLDNLPVLDHVNLDVSNQAIYYQLKITRSLVEALGDWDLEVFQAPASRSLYRQGITGVRFRAAIPSAQLPAGASQAQVTLEAIA